MTVKCNLIIDSCCDLPKELIDKEGIYLLQFPYIDSKGQHLDDLFQSVSPKEFYDGMRNGEEPTTSQLSMPDMKKAYEWAAETGVPTVFLCFTSGLSGTYDTAELVLSQVKEEHPELQCEVVDLKLAAAAEGMVVYEAIRQREKGLTADELVAWVKEARYFINCAFMIDDLEILRRGGRIPATVAFAGSKLDLKPLLSFDLDGQLTLVGMARGRKKGLKALAELFQKNSPESSSTVEVFTANADAEKDLEKLHELVTKINDNVMFVDCTVGPVIGCHVGPGMVAIIFWGKDRREEASIADRIASKVKGR